MKTVTRADLAQAAYLAAPARLSPAEVDELVHAVFDEIVSELACGGQVKISRFGTFNIKRSPPRVGRNPKRPAEAHAIPAQSRIAFRAAAELKQYVRNGGERE